MSWLVTFTENNKKTTLYANTTFKQDVNKAMKAHHPTAKDVSVQYIHPRQSGAVDVYASHFGELPITTE